MYKHILMAEELVKENRYVEDKTAQMQRLCNAKLSIIHVVEPFPSIYSGGGLDAMPDYNDSDTEQALIERAKQIIKPVAKRLGVTQSETIIAYGNVSYEILSYAEKNDIDLIITGSHGRHGLQLLLGSTANALLHRANCDVLSVRLK